MTLDSEARVRKPGGEFPEPPECEATGLRDFVRRPLTILGSYRREFLTPDLIAGLTVAAVAIPQAIAYASIAELPPHYGLYTAAVAAVVGALWGCSRFLATGPVNAVSLLVLPILLGVAIPGTPEYLLAASLIAVIAGCLSVAFSLLHFGALVTLASRSVLIGFTAGAAIHIAVGQLRHLLGLTLPATPELHRGIAAIVERLGQTNLLSLLLGLGTLVALLLLNRLGPRFPAALLAIVAAAVVQALFGLETRGVRVVGEIPRSLPPLTTLSTGLFPSLEMIRGVIAGSMAVAALGLIEAVASSQTLARRSGERLNANQEFFGQGLANIVSGLFSGYACSGSFTRSALAYQSGARTHLTGVFTGLAVLLGMLVFAPWAGRIPRTAIAGVLLVVAWRMVDREGIRRVLRTSRSETAIMAVTFGATLILPLDFAVLAGVVFSLAFFVVRSSLPRVVDVVPDPTYRHFVCDPDRPVCPQVGVLNIRGPLFFGAVYHIEEELRLNSLRHPGQTHLMLRLHGVDICDLSGIEMLESTIDSYRQRGGDVFIVRPRLPVLQVMEDSGFVDGTLGRDHILEQEGAIEHLFDKVLDPVICIYECEHRVFAECQALEKHPYDAKLPPAPKVPNIPGRHVSPVRFQELASDPDTLVLDVREPEEHLAGHVPGAGLLPLRKLLDEAPSLPRDRTVLLTCRSGRRTSRAIRMLEGMGFTKLYGLSGGILAWRAEGLPVTSAAAASGGIAPASRGLSVSEAGGSRQRQMLAAIRLNRRAEELDAELEALSTTRDLERLRRTLDRMLDRLAALRPGRESCIDLDPARPVLVVSGGHALRRAFRKLLLERQIGHATNLEHIVRGNLQLLLLGDLLHSEDPADWTALEREFNDSFSPQGAGAGPTPETDLKMIDGFGLAAMVMTLQGASRGVHWLKGNQDNLLNSEEGGNRKTTVVAGWPGEGEITRAWTLARMGSALAGKYAAWEGRLPLLAVYDNETGLKFLASHTEPAGPLTRAEIEQRSDETVLGLTWTDNEGRYAPGLLREIFGPDWEGARYLVTGAEEGIVHVRADNLIVLDKPRHLVAALIRPGFAEHEVHFVGES